MGVILPYAIELPQGIQIENLKVGTRGRYNLVKSDTSPHTYRVSFSLYYTIDPNKAAFMTTFHTLDVSDLSNIFEQIYNYVKDLHPNCVDDM